MACGLCGEVSTAIVSVGSSCSGSLTGGLTGFSTLTFTPGTSFKGIHPEHPLYQAIVELIDHRPSSRP
jgi:hypothetical protein